MKKIITLPAKTTSDFVRSFMPSTWQGFANDLVFEVDIEDKTGPTAQPAAQEAPGPAASPAQPKTDFGHKLLHGLAVVGNTALGIVPQAVPFIAPELTPFVPLIQTGVNAIKAAEAKHGQDIGDGAANTAKKADVVASMGAAAPLVTALLAKSGLTVTDPTQISKGVDALVEALIPLMKGLGQLPTKAQ